jgi:hypothetical protein
MKRFSERIGKRESRVEIQMDGMDDALRNGLWNIIRFHFLNPLQYNHWLRDSSFKVFVVEIWHSFLKENVDKIPATTDSICYGLKVKYFKWNYLDVYDFIEFIANHNRSIDTREFTNACNIVLKRELSGYRFINLNLSPITNEEEISEIERAISISSDNNIIGSSIHLTEALRKISDRNSPDYRNSIKESISAVESICQQIIGDPNAELGKALKKLKDVLSIHTALEQGFSKIYGYTSDGDGIRHALMEEPDLDQEDAIYMLVSCSAFVNYLIVKANKAGIIFKQ